MGLTGSDQAGLGGCEPWSELPEAEVAADAVAAELVAGSPRPECSSTLALWGRETCPAGSCADPGCDADTPSSPVAALPCLSSAAQIHLGQHEHHP